MKSYIVTRTGHSQSSRGEVSARVTFGGEGGGGYALHHVKVHSPSGFEFGYGGSGPADLALSILAEYFAEEDGLVANGENSKAWEWHQAFKQTFLAGGVGPTVDELEIPEATIKGWIAIRTMMRSCLELAQAAKDSGPGPAADLARTIMEAVDTYNESSRRQ